MSFSVKLFDKAVVGGGCKITHSFFISWESCIMEDVFCFTVTVSWSWIICILFGNARAGMVVRHLVQ